MTIKGYQIDADRHLVPIDPEQAPERSRQPDSLLWLDVEGPDRSDRAAWLDRLGIGGLARRLCLEVGDRLYFSFVTLTTLGYGDVTPVAPAAPRRQRRGGRREAVVRFAPRPGRECGRETDSFGGRYPIKP